MWIVSSENYVEPVLPVAIGALRVTPVRLSVTLRKLENRLTCEVNNCFTVVWPYVSCWYFLDRLHQLLPKLYRFCEIVTLTKDAAFI